MTQYEIAKRMKISGAAVSKWFTGKSLPSTKNLFLLSALLGTTPEETVKMLRKNKGKKKPSSGIKV